jgi:large subunit ribosomal protein L32
MVMTAFRKGSRARVRVTTPTTTVPTTMRAITETTRRCASSTTAGILGRRRASTTTTTTLADDLEAASTAFGCARGLDAELAEAMGNARARPFGTTTVMSMSMKKPSLGERVMVKAREEEEEEEEEKEEELASPLRADGGLESQILEMWLMAVPKRKVTPSRRKRRNQFKRLPFIESVVRCRMCGKVNRPHVHCCDVEERHDGGSSRGGDEGVSS